MLKRRLVPTPLFPAARRARVECVESAAPARFRGLEIALGALGVLARLRWLRLRNRYTPQEAGRELRRLFERLGGLWVKLGQLLSLRVDLFAPELCAELSRLQDRVKGFPAEEARQILEASLGAPLESCFDDFESEPIAAASIGQVHRAWLRQERVVVAVKVQRPNVAVMVARELRFLGLIVRLLDRLGVTPHLRWRRMLCELEQVMVEELDYRYEAANLRRMRRSLRRHKIHAPEVFDAYSGPRVLVTEFVAGVLLSDYIEAERSDPEGLRRWLSDNRVDAPRVGRRLVQSLMRQIFEDNLYHGDLHPGNILLLRDSHVALVDMGTVGVTDLDFLAKYRLFMRSMGALEFAKAADALILLGSEIPPVDLVELRAALIAELQRFAARTHVTTLPYHERSVSTIAAELIGILARFRCGPDWAFLRIRRAEQTLDASLVCLVPELNYTTAVTRYFRGAERRRLASLLRGGRLAMQAASALAAAIELQHRGLETSIFTSALVRRGAFVFEASTTKIAYLFETLFRSLHAVLFAVAALSALVLLHQLAPHSVEWLVSGRLGDLVRAAPRLEPLAWAALLGSELCVVRMCGRLRRRFAEREARTAG
jgi:ubiquinone biosynthesis protein